MVWSLQNGCAVAGRDRARKGRCDQDCKSKRGRKPEPFVQVQHSRHSSVALLQKRATARPGHRHGEQKRFAWPYRRARVISPGWQACRLHWVRSPQPTRLPLQFQFCAWRGSNAQPTAPKRIGLKSHRRLSEVLIKFALDYVIRRFNASSAGLKKLQGRVFAETPLSAIPRSNSRREAAPILARLFSYCWIIE